MPISSTERKAGPFYGNGVATTFTFGFKIFEPDELRVVRFSPSLGVDIDLTLGVDCNVSLNPDQDEAPGGVVTLAQPLAAGDRLALLSNVPDLQPVDITNQGGFLPDLVNNGLDRSTIQVQQVKEALGRAIKLPSTAEDGDYELPLPQGNKLLAWGQDGKTITNLDPGELISVVTYGNTKADKFAGDGTTAVFALTASPGSANNLMVSIDGVVQVPGDDYTWGGGKVLAFVVPPPAGTRIFVRYQEALDEGADVSAKADRNGANIGETDAPLFRAAISAAPGQLKRGATPRNVLDKVAERVSVKDYGAFGDGASHTLAATTAFRGVDTAGWTLPQWQVYFPSATSLGQEIDYLAHVEALRQAKAANMRIELYVPAGRYRLGDGPILVDKTGTSIVGDGPDATIWLTSNASGDVFTFKDMSTGGISKGNISPLVNRTAGAAIRFDNGHGLVSRDMKFDPGVWHGGALDAEHWSCYDMTAADAQFLYTVEDFEMNQVRFGFRIGQVGGYVQDVWIGKGVCVARRAGIQAFNVGGLYIYNMPDFLGCYWGLHVVPGAGQVVSGMMVNGFLSDTCDFHGVVMQPSGGGRIVDFQMSDVWSSSSGTNVPGGGGSLNACGIYIDGTDGVVSGGIINGPRCINNVSHGIQIKNAERITISNAQCNYNSVQSPGSFHGIMLDAGATNISVVGGLSGPAGKFKAQGLPTTQAYGVFMNVGSVSCRITAIDASNNITGGVYNAGTGCYVITPGAGLTQAAGAANTFGTAGFNRAPIPSFAIATSLGVSIGGFEPICGFNAYYDFGGATWRYQNDGPAAALVAYPAGLTLVRFAVNASGNDAPATIASSGLVATA